ncbi:MAG: hypothetical protein M3Y87_28650 [Myxococcota bacterium]|nr:hypothetical protein [Myxococcota bacterium]
MSESDDELEQAWADVLGAWDDEGTHARFLALVGAMGRHAEAGRRYREVKERDPARRAVADRRIEEILQHAVANVLLTTRAEPAPARRRLEWIALGVSTALIAAALWQVVR